MEYTPEVKNYCCPVKLNNKNIRKHQIPGVDCELIGKLMFADVQFK